MTFVIRKAERKKAKLRIGITGASGSGKTRSALEIALGIGGRIGLIDTESGRGELYAGTQSKHDADVALDYDIIRLEKPYTPDRYVEAIHAFEKAGYDTIIVDSLSHAWIGEGGILEMVDNSSGGKFQGGWKDATPKHNRLVEAIIQCKSHVICTFRSKTEYAVQLNDKGKHEPVKIGLAPVQRDGFEYEFTVFMSMDHKNIAHISKDNSELYHGQFLVPTPEMGRAFVRWLEEGADVQSPEEDFKANALPEMIAEIRACQDMATLRTRFSVMLNGPVKQYPACLAELVATKDMAKTYIEQTAKAERVMQ